MYTNSSSDYSSQTPPVDQSIPGQACASFSPVLHHLYGWTKMPSMATKAAKHQGLPDQPDRAGMRERRKQSEMTLTELQRSRGIQPPENPHAQILDAYGYRHLADLVFSIPRLTLRMLNAIGDTMTFRIGPPGADAAPVGRSDKSSGSVKLSTADFIKKYSNDFDIWLSPSAKNAADMKGIIIALFEHHYDPEVAYPIKKVMLSFRRTRGDRFFMEGGDLRLMREREQRYLMESGDCRLLELDSPIFARASAKMDELLKICRNCVEYIQQYVHESKGDLTAYNLYTYDNFIRKWSDEVPPAAMPGMKRLLSEFRLTVNLILKQKKIDDPLREADMEAGIRSGLTESALNYMVIGADHLHPMRIRLQDLRIIVMVPKLMVSKDPSLSLNHAPKQEL